MISKKAENHRTSWKKEKGKIYHIYRAGRGKYMTYDWQQNKRRRMWVHGYNHNKYSYTKVSLDFDLRRKLTNFSTPDLYYSLFYKHLYTDTWFFSFKRCAVKHSEKILWINSYWLVLMISLILKMKNRQDNALWLYEGPIIDYDPDIFTVPKIR